MFDALQAEAVWTFGVADQTVRTVWNEESVVRGTDRGELVDEMAVAVVADRLGVMLWPFAWLLASSGWLLALSISILAPIGFELNAG
jgi:hypothetical protein